ncbi:MULTISPECIES: HAD family hydrolase [unclassified Paenibacillus]|uniref:HAD family hydrolase n=1 Tax=unclassified Paenibacillus TaxID=185978 RepID=UPI00363D5811
MNNILLISDLDGTLLNASQQISLENELAIKRFIEKGGMFTLATGRMEEAVIPFIHKLGLDLPVILYNGAKIYCPVTDKVLYERKISLPQALWDNIRGRLSDELVLLVYQDGQVYAPIRNALLEKHELKDAVRCLPFEESIMQEPVTKLLIISSRLEEAKDIEQAVRDSCVPCEMVYSESNYLEILPQHATKGIALRELVRLLKVDSLYTVAVGDNLNDLTMIIEADLGYAVGNAHPLLADAADAVTVHHESHAIAAIIGEFKEKRRELA